MLEAASRTAADDVIVASREFWVGSLGGAVMNRLPQPHPLSLSLFL